MTSGSGRGNAMKPSSWFWAVAALAALGLATPTAAMNASTVAAAPMSEPPTLISLGFEWPLLGDDNRNAVVEVAYRKSGAGGWKPALPLLRIGAEEVRNGASFDVT